MYRMTNREVENTASPFLAYVLKPLQQQRENKHFGLLSKNVQTKLYETVLKKGVVDLYQLIDEIVSEEKKMHESLKKYKKETVSDGVINLSDFDKMQL